eukprot:s394_g3.t1
MEIDRMQGKGKHGDQGKGRPDRGNQKGKSKQKGKGKSKSKNSHDKGGSPGKGKPMQFQGKGKGSSNKNQKVCYICSRRGHFAKDCWIVVRSVEASSSAVGSGQSDWSRVTRPAL